MVPWREFYYSTMLAIRVVQVILTVQLNLSGVGGSAAGPSQVQVKYLQASSVSQKGKFTWANQVFKKNLLSFYFRLINDFFPLPFPDIR